MSPSMPQYIGGLSHLVEAATALTELEGRTRLPSVRQESKRSVHPIPSSSIVDAGFDCSSSSSDNIKKKEIFPQKLLEILADTSLSGIVSWLPHGRSFVIIRPDLFCTQVLPQYLPPVDSRGSTKYPSFTRKLNRWYVFFIYCPKQSWQTDFSSCNLCFFAQGLSSSHSWCRHWSIPSPVLSPRPARPLPSYGLSEVARSTACTSEKTIASQEKMLC